MNARYYQPSTGRFISQDSYTGNPYDPWTQHLYSYCMNNPTNFIDPTGHESTLDSYEYQLRMREREAREIISNPDYQRALRDYGVLPEDVVVNPGDNIGELSQTEFLLSLIVTLGFTRGDALNVNSNRHLANEYGRQYFGDVSGFDTTSANAFRHAMWQALNCRSNGELSAFLFACAHENRRGNDSHGTYRPRNAQDQVIGDTSFYAATRMDLHNNAVGIGIGLAADRKLTNDELADLVFNVVNIQRQGTWIFP